MSSISDFSEPDVPPLSPGSSVSTRLQDEYDELLKYAVVVPKYNPNSIPQTLIDARDSFAQRVEQSGSQRSSQRSRTPVSDRSRTPTKETRISITKEADGNASDVSDCSDVTPIVVRVSQEDVLPDFGGHSSISTVDDHEDRPHDPIPSHYFSSRLTKEHQPSSNDSPRPQVYSEQYDKVYTSTVDPDVSKMETMMDQWCLDLKRNVLAEFSQSKIRIVETGRHQLVKEQERHASEKMKLVEEMNNLKELLATYEKSIERKDQVISNLTHAMQKQRDKFEMLKKFCDWKIKHNDVKREVFCTNLARKHHQRQLYRKVWDAWHGVIESKWKSRLEKACQSKAQEVCHQLTHDYESRLKAANVALEASRMEVAQLHVQREKYEEMMKKAFMRGVCALNLEAMSMFQGENEQGQAPNERIPSDITDNLNGSLPEKDFSGPKTLPSEMYKMGTDAAPRVVTSQGQRSSSTAGSQGKAQTTSRSTSSKSKVVSAKVTAKVDTGRGSTLGGQGQVLAPPMSSVIVERHQPVTKQTMGHAVASKYPRQTAGCSDGQGGIAHRKIAGQGTLTVNPNIQTVKIVE